MAADSGFGPLPYQLYLTFKLSFLFLLASGACSQPTDTLAVGKIVGPTPIFERPESRLEELVFLQPEEEPTHLEVRQLESGITSATIKLPEKILNAWTAGNLIYVRTAKQDALFRANTGALLRELLPPLEIIGVAGDGERWVRVSRRSSFERPHFAIDFFVGARHKHTIHSRHHAGVPHVVGSHTAIPWDFQRVSVFENTKEIAREETRFAIVDILMEPGQSLQTLQKHRARLQLYELQDSRWKRLYNIDETAVPCYSLHCESSPHIAYSREQIAFANQSSIRVLEETESSTKENIFQASVRLLSVFSAGDGFAAIDEFGRIACVSQNTFSRFSSLPSSVKRQRYSAAIVTGRRSLPCPRARNVASNE